jgi:methionyl aminopeptidase
MSESGKRLRKVVNALLDFIKPGITTQDIDNKAELLIKKNDGRPSFKFVKGYSWATCLSVNNQVVHTPPCQRVLLNGDILTLDIGLYYKGHHTDYATTIIVGKTNNKKINVFLETGKKTLNKAIKCVQKGNYIGKISQTIQTEIEKKSYSIIPELTGHGIGRDLHEDPLVPCFLDGPIEKTYEMKKGLVLAIEVIYSKGKGKIKYEKGNDWSLITVDNSLAACFENTVAITDKGAVILV